MVVRPEVVIDVEEAKKLNKEESGGELKVLRHAPKGALNIPVTVASLTFNQHCHFFYNAVIVTYLPRAK